MRLPRCTELTAATASAVLAATIYLYSVAAALLSPAAATDTTNASTAKADVAYIMIHVLHQQKLSKVDDC
jgi:hypothetical protein